MGQTTYTPKPLDLSKVQLPDELNELVELMAKNVHEVWAKSRIEQGWTYGPVRDDAKRNNPCLVPYEELPEIEKDYDRNTALETLKLIMSVGFEIRRKK